MIEFDYDDILKRHDVFAPTVVASISEDNKLTIHREEGLDIAFVRQILMHWDEYEHQMTRELDELIDNKKGDK